MLPDRSKHVRVRANFDGEVEIKVTPGQRVCRGEALCVVEGDVQIETLSARADATVLSVEVDDGADVPATALILVLQ